MKLPILLAFIAAIGLLRFLRANLLVWAFAWWAGIYALLRFGFTAPIPSSVISIYMGIVSLATLAYVSSSRSELGSLNRGMGRIRAADDRGRGGRARHRRRP